jgi:hypothetical protein
MTRQATEGPMTVRVRLFGPGGATLASHTFPRPSSQPSKELVLEHTFTQSVAGVARLRVDTTRSGWAIWYEIEAFAPD